MSCLSLTIFSSCAGGFLRKIQRGANKMSTIPMMVITHGKPMVSAMDPPIDGPVSGKNKAGWFDLMYLISSVHVDV